MNRLTKWVKMTTLKVVVQEVLSTHLLCQDVIGGILEYIPICENCKSRVGHVFEGTARCRGECQEADTMIVILCSARCAQAYFESSYFFIEFHRPPINGFRLSAGSRDCECRQTFMTYAMRTQDAVKWSEPHIRKPVKPKSKGQLKRDRARAERKRSTAKATS